MKSGGAARHERRRSLKRKVGNREELKTIVVFTGGRNSEPDYINALKRLPHIANNVALSVEIHPEHGVPITLVDEAKRWGRDSEIDESWCLFDVEWPINHPNLREAIDVARRSQIYVAVSNPCFEIWLILHHRDHGAWCDTAQAESQSRAIDGRSGKSLDADTYMPLRQVAAGRAKHLDKRHKQDGTEFPDDNPSSGMYRFLEALEGNASAPATA